ncbi:putative phospholipase D [Helianthus anomalus]
MKHCFNIPVAHHAAEIHFLVKDSDVVGSQLIGVVAIPVEHISIWELESKGCFR